MEAGRKPSPSVANAAAAGYFGTLFTSPSTVTTARDPLQGELHTTLSKQRTDGRIGSDGQAQGSWQTTKGKEYKAVYPSVQLEESSYFGSSVHYGCRDVYISSSSNQITGTQKHFGSDEGDDSGKTNVAIGGEWWRGCS